MDIDGKNQEAQTVGGNGVPPATQDLDDVIELTDVIEEPSGGEAAHHSGLHSESEETASIDADALDEDDVIELVDEAVDESESEDEEVIELSDVVEDEDLQPEEGALSQESSPRLGTEGFMEQAQDFKETESDRALESTILERVSDEQIEAIVTRVVERVIEKKADRVLLEVAESAIAKEIEKIKQAL